MSLKPGQLMILYHVKEEERGGETRKFWNRHGRAFVNKDGKGLSLYIESLPLGVTADTAFVLRENQPREKKEAEGFEE